MRHSCSKFVGDAIKYLEDCCSEQRQFDFIFGDLTDVPIDTDTDGNQRKSIEYPKSLSILRFKPMNMSRHPVARSTIMKI